MTCQGTFEAQMVKVMHKQFDYVDLADILVMRLRIQQLSVKRNSKQTMELDSLVSIVDKSCDIHAK